MPYQGELFTIDDMEYDRCNAYERYLYTLENGDILELVRYYYRGNPRAWEWSVCVKEKFPWDCYAKNIMQDINETAEDTLMNFFNQFQHRTWRSSAEIGPVYYTCKICGWEGTSDEIQSVSVYRDYGDVSTVKCPGCGRIEDPDGDFFLLRSSRIFKSNVLKMKGERYVRLAT